MSTCTLRSHLASRARAGYTTLRSNWDTGRVAPLSMQTSLLFAPHKYFLSIFRTHCPGGGGGGGGLRARVFLCGGCRELKGQCHKIFFKGQLLLSLLIGFSEAKPKTNWRLEKFINVKCVKTLCISSNVMWGNSFTSYQITV